MNRFPKLFSLILILVSLAGIWLVKESGLFSTESTPSASASPTPSPLVESPVTPAPIAQPLDNSAIATPEAEQDAEPLDEAQIDQESMDEAKQSLQSQDPEERVAGIEQLSSDPNEEAETLIINILNSDSNADVRSAAAQNLLAFDNPSEAAISALLAALQDVNEDVQTSALDTLESIVSAEESESDRYLVVVSELKKSAKSPKLKVETKKSLQDFLQDLEP